MRIFAFLPILLISTFALFSFQAINPNKKQVEKGKQLFNKFCVNCHHPNKSFLGPPFQRIREVRGNVWVYKFMKNPGAMASSDKQVKEVVKKFKAIMPAYLLPTDQIDAIIDYVDSFPYNPNSKDYEHRKIK